MSATPEQIRADLQTAFENEIIRCVNDAVPLRLRERDLIVGACRKLDDLWTIAELESDSLPVLARLVKRGVLDRLLGGTWFKVDVEEAGVKQDLSDQNKALLAMRAVNETEITYYRQNAPGRAGGAVGQMATQNYLDYPAPCQSPFDPNNQTYAGDARRRGFYTR